MRLFIAAELPSEIIETLSETSALLRDCVRGRYVPPDSFHVTLAFLGSVEPSRVGEAEDALEAGCEGAESFSAVLGELGVFGKRSKATLWQGFQDEGAFPDLAKAVRCQLRRRGFSFDEKPFCPHVTLMRAADVTAGVLPPPLRASGRIESIALFKSDLSGERPVYELLHSVRLRDCRAIPAVRSSKRHSTDRVHA